MSSSITSTSIFSFWSPKEKRIIFYLFSFCSLCMLFIMTAIAEPLITHAAPFGMISFEFAYDQTEIQSILYSWDQKAKLHCAMSLGIDYLFLFVYSMNLCLGCVYMAENVSSTQNPILKKIGMRLAEAQVLAGVLDAIENYCLYKLLLGETGVYYGKLATSCACVKFIIVLLGILYIIGTMVYSQIIKSRAQDTYSKRK